MNTLMRCSENPYLPWFVLNELNRDADQFLK